MSKRPPSRRHAGAGSGGRDFDPTRLSEMRRRLLKEGIAPGDLVPPEIVRSWRRSQAFGLDLDQHPNIEALSHPQMREVIERNEALVRAARGEIEALYDDVRSAGGIAILTDPHGVILATTGNIDFAERAARVSLRPGVDWNEASIGTNAIGTAIAEQREIAVTGAQHFFEAHRILSCSAVPILDPAGRVIGVLDLSNDADLPQTHTLALVKRAVEQIERRLFESRFGHHERLHFHVDPNLVDSPHEGLLAFDEGCLVGANRYGLDLLGLEWSSLGLLRFDEIFDTERSRLSRDGTAVDGRLRTLRGSTMFGRLSPPPRAIAPRRAAVAPGTGDDDFEVIFDDDLAKRLDRAVRLVDAGVPILITGEIGSGKEAFARRLHADSRRREGPLQVVDCSAMAEGDLEAALFGRGEARDGFLARAAGGILLLEAIETLPLAVQIRLEKALKAGPAAADGDRAEAADVAVVSTTHTGLQAATASGAFRRDLAMRLSAYTVEIEPLRRRPDHRALIAGVWARIAPPPGGARLTPEALAALADYHWPGNYRQLFATLRALAVLGDGGEPLDLDALPQEIRAVREPAPAATVGVDVEVGLDSITLSAMRAAVDAEGGNVSRAARRLGIHRSTLYRRLFGTSK